MTLVNIYSMLSIYQSRLPKSSTINVINRNDSILFWINFIYNSYRFCKFASVVFYKSFVFISCWRNVRGFYRTPLCINITVCRSMGVFSRCRNRFRFSVTISLLRLSSWCSQEFHQEIFDFRNQKNSRLLYIHIQEFI